LRNEKRQGFILDCRWLWARWLLGAFGWIAAAPSPT
jgi:hypothetical protein